MKGILGVAGYVPRCKLTAEAVASQWGGSPKGERAAANHDEDTITMASEAIRYCMEDSEVQAESIDGLVFASTTSPYAEKHAAAFLSAVANLKSEISTLDVCGGTRAGTSSIKTALDMVKAGSAKQVIVAAADLRLTEPADPMERQVGDGAAALIIGEGDPIAEIVDIVSTVHEFTDVWRLAGERFLKSADAKFLSDKGYTVFMAEAAKILLERNKIKSEDIALAAIYSPEARSLKAIAAGIGIDLEKVVNITGAIGNTGCAQPLMNLVMALEKAKPGDLILVLGHGSGADAILVKATGKIEGLKSKRGLSDQWSRAIPISSYAKYLNYRGIIEGEKISPWSALPVLWREEKENWRLIAKKCNKCGAIQYPVRRVCWKCSAKDDFSDQRLNMTGKVFTFTKDHLVPTPEPPVIMATVELEGGGRFYGQITDCKSSDVRIGMEVELTLRKIHTGGEYVNYFWKFRPL